MHPSLDTLSTLVLTRLLIVAASLGMHCANVQIEDEEEMNE